MVSDDPQGVAWSVELRSSGRVCADVRRWRAALGLLVSPLMLAMAVGLIAFTGVGGRIFGVLVLLLAVPLVVMTLQQLLRVGSWRSPQVVVDAEGVTVRRGWLRAPWPEIHGAVALTANHNHWVALVLSAECYDAWWAGRPRVLRLITRRARRRRHGMLQLPPNLSVDHEAFAAWLTHEAQERLRARVEAARRDLDGAVAQVRDEAERLAEQERLRAQRPGS